MAPSAAIESPVDWNTPPASPNRQVSQQRVLDHELDVCSATCPVGFVPIRLPVPSATSQLLFDSLAMPCKEQPQRLIHTPDVRLDEQLVLESLELPATPCSSPLPLAPRPRKLKFADELGMALEDSIPFFRFDEPWRCSKSPRPPSPTPCAANGGLMFTAALPQSETACCSRTAERHVCLEACTLRVPHVFMTVRVLNQTFEKNVCVRFTTDNWSSFTDVPATYLPGSDMSGTTKFLATLSVPAFALVKRLEFAVCFRAKDVEFWDNNNGANYCIASCTPSTAPMHATDFAQPSLALGPSASNMAFNHMSQSKC
eukprot:m.351779 g.351779  ORF g.351779 m.351779 type:complete len:314 (-) comp16349_c0_seq1:575-1516(-)